MLPDARRVEENQQVVEGTHTATNTILGNSSEKNICLALTVYRPPLLVLKSPIQCLYPEILVLIFMEVFHADYSRVYKLAQVCRFWNEIALSISELWARFFIDLTSIYSTSREFLSLLDLRLQRARLAPLHITLLMDSVFIHDGCTENPAFVKILESSNQWATATFIVSKSTFHYLEIFDGNLQNLRRFRLYSGLLDGVRNIVFNCVPSLCDVQIDSRVPGILSRISFPWKQLLTYEGNSDHFTRNLNMMISCRNLTLHWTRNDSLPVNGLTVMNALEALHLTTPYLDLSGIPCDFFSKIRFPNLRELDVSSCRLDDILKRLASTIRESDQPSLLKSLKFRGSPDCSGAVLQDLLQLTPYLEDLDFDLPDNTHDLDRLTFFLSSPNSLPKLRKLTFFRQSNSIRYYYTRSYMDRIISARCDIPKPQTPRGQDFSIKLEFPSLRSSESINSLPAPRTHK